MAKRMPKSDGYNFMVKFYLTDWKTGQVYSSYQSYATKEVAEAAMAIAKTHKTKKWVSLHEAIPCPDSLEKQKERSWFEGASWDCWSGQYLYSARY